MFKFLGLCVLYFLAVLIQPWLLMIMLGNLHDELEWVPALSFEGSCQVFVIAVILGAAGRMADTVRGFRNKE